LIAWSVLQECGSIGRGCYGGQILLNFRCERSELGCEGGQGILKFLDFFWEIGLLATIPAPAAASGAAAVPPL
jgi:hypothetical protein